jgi:ankyrin repeat protein
MKLRQGKRSTFDALHRLIKHGDIVSLQRELDAGTSPNLSNRFSWTLLMLAALEGNLKIGELLISRGADINATNKLGETALSLAAHRAHMRLIKLLLTHGASIDCLPHGSNLEDRLRSSSGPTDHKIADIMDVVRSTKSR